MTVYPIAAVRLILTNRPFRHGWRALRGARRILLRTRDAAPTFLGTALRRGLHPQLFVSSIFRHVQDLRTVRPECGKSAKRARASFAW
jgi:hypothetical protein